MIIVCSLHDQAHSVVIPFLLICDTDGQKQTIEGDVQQVENELFGYLSWETPLNVKVEFIDHSKNISNQSYYNQNRSSDRTLMNSLGEIKCEVRTYILCIILLAIKI